MCSTTTNSCFKLFAAAPSIPSTSQKVCRITRKVDDLPTSRSWNSQSAIIAGFAYAVIGIGVSSLVSSESFAATMKDDEVLVEVAARRQRVALRWSDKRACPPWRSKSFEQVVPENLPRASPRHKVESIGNRNHSLDAPVVGGIGIRGKGVNGDCFSL